MSLDLRQMIVPVETAIDCVASEIPMKTRMTPDLCAERKKAKVVLKFLMTPNLLCALKVTSPFHDPAFFAFRALETLYTISLPNWSVMKLDASIDVFHFQTRM